MENIARGNGGALHTREAYMPKKGHAEELRREELKRMAAEAAERNAHLCGGPDCAVFRAETASDAYRTYRELYRDYR